MKRIIRLTESDLTRIVRRIIKESKENLPTPFSIGGITLLGGGSRAKKGTIEKVSDNEVEITIDGLPDVYDRTDWGGGSNISEIYTFRFKIEDDMLDLVSVITQIKDDETNEIEDVELDLEKITRSGVGFFEDAPYFIRGENGKLNTYFAPLSFYKMFGLTN
jgi:hypothetical protein